MPLMAENRDFLAAHSPHLVPCDMLCSVEVCKELMGASSLLGVSALCIIDCHSSGAEYVGILEALGGHTIPWVLLL